MRPNDSRHSILETKVFFGFIIFFCFAFQALSYFTLWTETEVYSVHSSQYLLSQYANEFLFALKPIFHSFLKLSFSLSSLFDLMPMTSARFLFAINGLVILALMYFYINNKTNRYNAILAVLFLASANIFLDRGFRVRSDLLSTSFSLLYLLLNLKIKEGKSYWKLYIALPILFSIILISPKGIYWIILTSLLFWHDIKNKVDTSLVVKITAIMCFALYFLSSTSKDPFLLKIATQSAQFYLLNIQEIYHYLSQHSLVNTIHKLSHFGLFINRNLFVVLIIILKFLFMIHSLFLSKKRKGDLSDLHFLFLIFIMLFHPQQKLFFLSALTPFLCISFFTDSVWRHILNAYSPRFKSFLLTGFFIYAGFYISSFNYRIYTKRNNSEQKATLKELNDFYKNTDHLINIFDPGCIIFSRKTNCKYILYDKSLQNNLTSYIQNKNFDIILSSFSVSPLKVLAYKDFYFKYANIDLFIYYKAFIIDKETAPEFIKKDLQLKNQKFLMGGKILEAFEKSNQIALPKPLRQYFYLQVDDWSRPLNKKRKCKSSPSLILQEGCYYSEDTFRKSLMPITDKKIAVFYTPFPFHIHSKKTLPVLLQYDKY